MKNRFENKSLFRILSLVFFLSGISLTVLLSLRPMPIIYYVVEFVLCSLIWGYIAFKYRFIHKVVAYCTRTDLIFSILLSAAFVPTHYQTLDKLIHIFLERNIQVPVALTSYFTFFLSHKQVILTLLLAFASFSLCFIFMYVSGRLRTKIIDFFKGLARYEKVFLLTGCAVFALVTVILFSQSNIYYQPEREDTGPVLWDIVYTFDSGSNIKSNCYANPASPDNDLKQSLFGVFAMPFGLCAHLISFLIPSTIAYPVCINIIQIILLFITILLLSRMLNAGKETTLFFLIFSVAAFPFLLFAFNMEQYIFALFWTIVLVYNSFVTKKTNDVLSVAAAGSIITSVILIPLLYAINKEYKMIIHKGWHICRMFFAIFICGGVIDVIYRMNVSINDYVGFLSNHGYMDKLRQFTHFILSCLMAPHSRLMNYNEHIAYQLDMPDSFNLFGIIILVLAVWSGVLFRRRFIAKISLYWVGFSFALIAMIGWGTAENGTILYSLYIYWAFTILLSLLIDALFSKTKYLMYAVYGILITMLSIYNIKGILEIVNFGLTYYPRLNPQF